MKETDLLKIRIISDLVAGGINPEYLLWVGCAGSYDDRYKKVIRALVKVLNFTGVDFAVLGPEESCTGDPARRAGNEMLFQMQALSNIQLLNKYNIKKIITACPHCYNTIKNEYPALGGKYKVVHHSELLDKIIEQQGPVMDLKWSREKPVTYHDSCYLGRSNDIYDSPRNIIRALHAELREMDRNRSGALCCGAGGSQMFKETEAGDREINLERTKEAIGTRAEIIATACPFCLTMITDGVNSSDKTHEIKVLDVVELFEKALNKPS
jgi:heterodisulfide reductase subunit D